MPSDRPLPSRLNPLLQPDDTPLLEILVERRRLGQTSLSVKPGQVGTSNATKVENLGVFDYAHLRAPLPKDLKGSGMFSGSRSSPLPESYFLMRRSKDGFVSATGMFKAAFPWASKAEEEAERQYLKKLESTDPEEVAGNIWVPAEFALELADQYHIREWIVALLDNDPIPPAQNTDPSKRIKSPPAFTMPPKKLHPEAANAKPDTGTANKRSMRSVSPAKSNMSAPPQPPAPTPSRPKATPRKPRAKKPSAKTGDDSVDATPSVADSAADSADELDGDGHGAKQAPEHDAESEAEDGKEDASTTHPAAMDNKDETELPGNTVRVSVNTDVQNDGDVETRHTTVKIDMPADSAEITLPRDSEGLVAKAQEIVDAAAALQDGRQNISIPAASKKGGRKRKMEEVEAEDRDIDEMEVIAVQDPEEGVAQAEIQSLMPATKRARVMVPAEEYRREKVQKRALLAMSATLAVGVMIPFLNAIFYV